MEEETVILFTGDSITDGNRYKKKEQEWDLNHQMGHSYAYIINGVLGSRYPQKGFYFKNRGVSGNRIADLYARSEKDLFPLKPDVLSVLIGVNDGPGGSNHGIATPPEVFEETYCLFLDAVRAKLPACKLILLEPFVCNAGRLKPEYTIWRECISEYGRIVKRLAEKYDAVFVPLQEVFDKKCREVYPEYWSWDGVHPTENGHGLIAAEWMKKAGKLLGLPDFGMKCSMKSLIDGKKKFIQYALRKALVWSYLGKTISVKIDRPIGTEHPKHPGLIYPINYGYIEGVIGGDGEELDVYILGIKEPVMACRVKVIGIAHRKNDVEDKLIAAPEGFVFSKRQITEAIYFQEQYYQTEIEVI